LFLTLATFVHTIPFP